MIHIYPSKHWNKLVTKIQCCKAFQILMRLFEEGGYIGVLVIASRGLYLFFLWLDLYVSHATLGRMIVVLEKIRGVHVNTRIIEWVTTTKHIELLRIGNNCSCKYQNLPPDDHCGQTVRHDHDRECWNTSDSPWPWISHCSYGLEVAWTNCALLACCLWEWFWTCFELSNRSISVRSSLWSRGWAGLASDLLRWLIWDWLIPEDSVGFTSNLGKASQLSMARRATMVLSIQVTI